MGNLIGLEECYDNAHMLYLYMKISTFGCDMLEEHKGDSAATNLPCIIRNVATSTNLPAAADA